jgi:bifunctional ADP-heptose synthase (sugar kinase/adenylyltransferase)
MRKRFPRHLVSIDSRNHLIKFKGANMATPNEPELKRIFPDFGFATEIDYYQAGKDLLSRLDARGIILKRGSKGMVAFEAGKKPQVVDIFGVTDIVDETGAGDTVIAVASLAVLAGADLATAARLASIAAGIVVMKEGAYPIGFEELLRALHP